MMDYKRLSFWEKSHQLALKIYKATSEFPKHEMYGITSQLRRASLSVPTNIVEGCGRDSKAELKRFLVIANGSAAEVEYLLFFSREIEYLSEEKYIELSPKAIEVKKLITSYKSKI